jgi:preprotein translocase subunit YajC
LDATLFIRQFGPLIIIFAIFYFLFIKPQQKRDKERRNMLQALSEGDNIITIGGIYGKILSIKDDIVTLEISDKAKIKITRTAVGSVISKTENN